MKFKIRIGMFCLAFSVLRASSATHYVDLNNAYPVSPYSDWSRAATNIQDAIDVSSDGDLVLVSNGVYQTGGRMTIDSTTNRVVVDKAVTLQSVNGPSVTMIEGNAVLNSNAVRCVYMTNTSTISGFTLTNGGTLNSGGGIWTTNSGAIISNCVVIGNVAGLMGGGAYNGSFYSCSIIQNSAGAGGGIAYLGTFTNIPLVTNSYIAANSAVSGGGIWGGILENCRVIQNMATYGGGACMSSLFGCLVAGNAASQFGGGIYEPAFNVENCTIVSNSSYQEAGGISGGSTVIYNSIIYDNTVTIGSSPNYDMGFSFDNCCTIPMPANAINTITNDPGFVSYTSGDFRPGSNSPCINGGKNEIISRYLRSDLGGSPRIVDGLVDIGAYEYQASSSILPYYWAQEYGFCVNEGTIDSDGDGMNNWKEAMAGTNPTNAASVLEVSVSNSTTGIMVTWPGEANKIYYLQRSTNLLGNPGFVSIYTNPFSLPFPTTLRFADAPATNGSSRFYRVGVLY